MLPAPPALPPGVISPGVTIAGVQVGGLTRAAAREAVLAQYVAPRRAKVPVTFRGRTLAIDPVTAGYAADVRLRARRRVAVRPLEAAAARGRHGPAAPEGQPQAPARRALAAGRDVRPARQGRLALLQRGHPGRQQAPGRRRHRRLEGRDGRRPAILVRDRPVYPLPSKRVRPAVTSVGPAIIIERNAYRLTLWRAGKRRTFGIAVGQAAYPTPSGTFHSSPSSATRPGSRRTPRGPPVSGRSRPASATRSAPAGSARRPRRSACTGPRCRSIAPAASHGCVRMYIGDVEYLYDQIEVGTPVRIV